LVGLYTFLNQLSLILLHLIVELGYLAIYINDQFSEIALVRLNKSNGTIR
jgi:hypothetical protein